MLLQRALELAAQPELAAKIVLLGPVFARVLLDIDHQEVRMVWVDRDASARRVALAFCVGHIALRFGCSHGKLLSFDVLLVRLVPRLVKLVAVHRHAPAHDPNALHILLLRDRAACQRHHASVGTRRDHPRLGAASHFCQPLLDQLLQLGLKVHVLCRASD